MYSAQRQADHAVIVMSTRSLLSGHCGQPSLLITRDIPLCVVHTYTPVLIYNPRMPSAHESHSHFPLAVTYVVMVRILAPLYVLGALAATVIAGPIEGAPASILDDLTHLSTSVDSVTSTINEFNVITGTVVSSHHELPVFHSITPSTSQSFTASVQTLITGIALYTKDVVVNCFTPHTLLG